MKTIFAQHQDNGGNNVAGVFPSYARKCHAISQTSQAKPNGAPARWPLGLWRALVAWIKTFRRVCAVMQNRRPDPSALLQSNY